MGKAKRISELSKEEEERALELHKSFIFINGLDCSSLHMYDEKLLQTIKEGSVTAGNKTVVLYELKNEKYARLGIDHEAILRKISDYHRFFDDYSDNVMLVTTAGDILEAKKAGKYGIIMGLQNAAPIGENVEKLAVLSKLGIRIIQLSYNFRNLYVDGCAEKSNAGLSMLGEEVVKEMNRLGIIIDLSHVGHKSTMEAIELSKDPVLFTHANAYGLYPVERNKRDDEIKALANKGGVIGLNGFAPTVKGTDIPTIEDYLDHLDYVANLVGADHIGIGLDFPVHYTSPEWVKLFGRDFPTIWTVPKAHEQLTIGLVKGLESPSLWPNITKGLIARKYSDEEIEKILGGNFMRVFKAVWK